MRGVIALALVLALMGAAYAELQNVEVGGRIEIRGRYYRNAFTNGAVGPRPAPVLVLPAAWAPNRPLGAGPLGVTTVYDYDRRGNDWAFAEQATSLHVKADFTDNVNALIELYEFSLWGTDFRSDYITGADQAGAGNVELLQSYIETNETFGLPVRVRMGRQTLQLGKGWLVTDKTTPTQRISFDGIRMTYAADDIEVDAWWTKLAETSPVEEDGDVDFYGVYGTYSGWEPLSLSAYWMWVRDARSVNDTYFGWPGDQIEKWLGYDDYDVTNLHTVGMRAFGRTAGFDYDWELAYQFGNADGLGVRFKQNGYGDNEAEWDHWGTDLEVGYTFDVKWSPRVFAAYTHFDGEDNRDLSFAQWANPFRKGDASVSFNRLFSDKNYCPTLNDNGDLSNFTNARVGVQLKPAEKISLLLRAGWNWVDEPFAWPAHMRFGRFRLPYAPNLAFWDQESDDYLGLTTCTVLTYRYSEDLSVMLYWGHLFTGGSTKDGNFLHSNALSFDGGINDDDVDYVFMWWILKF